MSLSGDVGSLMGVELVLTLLFKFLVFCKHELLDIFHYVTVFWL